MVDDLKRAQLSYEAQLLDPQLLAMATRYYRLVARWLVGEARPPAEGLPLGASVPRRFAVLPMHRGRSRLRPSPEASSETCPERGFV